MPSIPVVYRVVPPSGFAEFETPLAGWDEIVRLLGRQPRIVRKMQSP